MFLNLHRRDFQLTKVTFPCGRLNAAVAEVMKLVLMHASMHLCAVVLHTLKITGINKIMLLHTARTLIYEKYVSAYKVY